MGDAAHQMPPFAGQGLAGGWRDAANLAWKLDLVLRGKASDKLLDTYSRERINHVQEFIDFSIGLGKIICITDEQEAKERDQAMKAALRDGEGQAPPAPKLGDGLHRGEHGGTLSHQGFVTTDEHSEKVRFDDIFGTGALIAADAELVQNLTAAEVTTLDDLGIAVTYVTGSEDRTVMSNGAVGFHDEDGAYTNWFAELGASAILVRPDLYIYDTATEAMSVHEMASAFVRAVSTGEGLD